MSQAADAHMRRKPAPIQASSHSCRIFDAKSCVRLLSDSSQTPAGGSRPSFAKRERSEGGLRHMPCIGSPASAIRDDYLVAAWAQGRAGSRAEAIDLLRRGIAAMPNESGLHLNLGYTLTNDGRPVEALASIADLEIKRKSGGLPVDVGMETFLLSRVRSS